MWRRTGTLEYWINATTTAMTMERANEMIVRGIVTVMPLNCYATA